MFTRRSTSLPKVPIYTLTWGISDEFGGITSSAIQRTKAFSQSGHRQIEFLTLDPATDPKQKKKQLVKQGWLDKHIKVRNLWADLRKLSDRTLQSLHGSLAPSVTIPRENLLDRGQGLTSERKDKNGNVVQTDYFRADGSVVVSDNLETNLPGQRKGRLITLFTSLGMQLGQWTNASDFYFAWLDYLNQGREAILITDSPGIGGRMRNYDRPNIVKAQVLHNFHLADPTGHIDGAISTPWKNIVINSDKYDVLAILTDQQRQDLTRSQLNPGNLVTLSNMFRGELISNVKPRPPELGMQVSRLTGGKRVDHSIQAIAQVGGARLDVYGYAHEAEYENSLKNLIHELGITDRVALRGYDRNAKERFQSASFSLLPSLYEGQGLVLIESMASGCIPIAYDIRYGPSSIIDHGINGFLVPSGDIDALASAIRHVTTMNQEELQTMRHAAVDKAKQYLPEKVVSLWGHVLNDALAKKTHAFKIEGCARLNDVTIGDAELSMRIEISGTQDIDWGGVAWISRSDNLYGRVSADIHRSSNGVEIECTIPISTLDRGVNNIYDLFVDLGFNGVSSRLRIASSPNLELPAPVDRFEPYTTANDNFSVKIQLPED